MKRLLIVAFLVVAAAIGYRTYGSPQTGTGDLTLPQPWPTENEPAPTFEASPPDGGESFELSREGVYVVAFLSTLNRDTAEARPALERLAREYGGDGVSFAAVYVSNIPADEGDVPYTVLQDGSGELTAMYNVKKVPRLFLVNDGAVEFVQNGYYSENEERLREELESVLDETY